MAGPEGINQSNESVEREIVFSNVIFSEKFNKSGQVVAWESSQRGRKTLRLVPGLTPPPGPHTVKVVSDSKPEDPLSGFYTVEFAADQNVDWPLVSGVVRSVEDTERQLRKTRRLLYAKTQIPADQRTDDWDEMIYKEGHQRIVEKGLEKELDLKGMLDQVLGPEGSLERQFVGFKLGNLKTALREEKSISDSLDSLHEEEVSILKRIEGTPSGLELEALDEVREDIEKRHSRREQLLASSPEAYYGLHLKELKKYKTDMERGRIVETPYVKNNIDDIVDHVRAGKPVMIYGHLGSGKTELAMHVARNFILANRPDIDEKVDREFEEWLLQNPGASADMQKKERNEIDASQRSALVISGAKNMSSAEFYGHKIMYIEKIKKDELDTFVADVEKKYEEWVEKNKVRLAALSPEAAEEEKDRAHDRFLQTYLTQFKGGTISNFFLGPIYRAMQEGRPVIIDEVNAIPHELLISLNHILTRRVGDEVNVQQNSGSVVTIKEGYGVIMTGNLNQGDERYVDRQDMDPAFLSRVYKIEYDYLPQITEGALEEEAEPSNELFQLLISKIMDKNGNLEVPEALVDKLWNLAKAARVTQNVFSGKEVNQAYYFKAGGTRPIKYLLKESVLSMRALDGIISQMQKDGYKYEIDYYIWHEFISQSTNQTDKAYLYQLLKDQFGFFTSPGWEQQPNYGTGGTVVSFDIKVPKNPAESVEFSGPKKVIDQAYGPGPQREKWPKAARKK